jgi:hypothetical protein
VSTIALLCFVLLCTPVQLDCSLAALQADLLFTPVNICSVYSLEALQANFEDPFLEPPTGTLRNLFMECTKWMDEGNQLIIGIDANEDIRTSATAEFFQTLGLRNAILDKHSQWSPPATHNRNNQRQPIDGLFVTPGLQAVAAGYSGFGAGCPSDHLVSWADFTYTDAFGLAA